MTSEPEILDMLIVGAGISGLGMAAHLQEKCPSKTYRIWEARDRLGGTWDLFRYPGVRSDSDMYTLGYAIEPWRGTGAIAQGADVLNYLERVAGRRGIGAHIDLGRRALSADWDHNTAVWRVTGSDGKQTAARFLFLGSGYYDYDQTYQADIPGLDRFQGRTLHPQFWPQDFDQAGTSIAVIGSGATAATLVPALAEKAARVVMIQRTPSWYMSVPTKDRFAGLLNQLLPARAAHGLTRWKNTLVQAYFFRKARKEPRKVGAFLTRAMRKDMPTRFCAQDFAPPYGPWEQRMCFVPDGDFLKAIEAGQAEIVTGRIAQVDAGAIVIADGRRIEVDTIVTATGLKVALFGGIALSIGRRPLNLAEHFQYRSCMFSNVPNLAALFGYLNASWTLRVEIVADWLCRLLNQMDAWDRNVATPYLAADHDLIEDMPLKAFSSGYIHRAAALIPRSATIAPWRLGMDYLADRRELRDAPIDDGVLRFARGSIVAGSPLA